MQRHVLVAKFWESLVFVMASQEIPRIVRNPMIHCRFHESFPLVHILSQIIPLRAYPTYFFNTRFVILPSVPCSAKCSLSLLGGSTHTVTENAEALVVATKEIGLEVNADKTKYTVMSRE